jgi:hypothetical protein
MIKGMDIDSAAVVGFRNFEGLSDSFIAKFGVDYSNIGIFFDRHTNRIRFDPVINKVTVIDAGGIEAIKRRFPFIGKQIEVGIPPIITLDNTIGIRVKFNDVKGNTVTIFGLIVKTR